jgi:MFS transporter, FLVCR family, MFS-domain-containing protein 7
MLVQADNTIILTIIFAVVGLCSLSLLAIALELAVELTRAPVASTALLWGMAHVVSILFINGAWTFSHIVLRLVLTRYFETVETVLKAGPGASPPSNMRKGLVFQAFYVCVSALFVIPLKGEQKRRKRDERGASYIVGISGQNHAMGTREEEGKDNSMEEIELA